jgi:aldehyde dehydrogenase (NAD+)
MSIAVCSAGSRIFVQEGIYDSFVKAFTESSKALKLGDPFSEETVQGPQISKIHFDVCCILSYVGYI